MFLRSATMTTAASTPPQRLFKRDLVFLLPKLRRTKPEYVNCIGAEVSWISTTGWSGPGLTLWNITGELKDDASQTQGAILELCRIELRELNLPTKPYVIRCFFLGLTKYSASPIVGVLCDDRDYSSALKRIIDDSQLQSWPCVRLHVTVQALMVSDIPAMTSTDLRAYTVHTLVDKIPENMNAVGIEIRKDNQPISKATIGGIIVADGEHFALTVAHAFTYPHHSGPTPGPLEIDVSELKDLFEGPKPTSFPGERYTSMVSVSQLPPAKEVLSAGVSPPAPIASSGGGIHIGELSIISRLSCHDIETHPSLDWALVKLNDALPSQIRYTNSIPVDGHGQVVVLTPRASLQGRLLSDAVFGLPVRADPQSVSTIQVDLTQDGDSGSWVIGPKDKEVRGMLIGACQPLHEAYFLRMEEILKDIERQIKKSVTIASEGDSGSLVIPGNKDNETLTEEASLRMTGKPVHDIGGRIYNTDRPVPEPAINALEYFYWINERKKAVRDLDHEKKKREPRLDVIQVIEKVIKQAELVIEQWNIENAEDLVPQRKMTTLMGYNLDERLRRIEELQAEHLRLRDSIEEMEDENSPGWEIAATQLKLELEIVEIKLKIKREEDMDDPHVKRWEQELETANLKLELAKLDTAPAKNPENEKRITELRAMIKNAEPE
ncbi:hypothetical protein F5B22DRAFT_226546 [Xylaria bambusicola]|uniref:uncharacterized protein n=1 Tax=Xylaria bambusicola TaxID=326684 RepID=UPI002008C4C4|nr:uncharacterized protein F5B22DRAFT_226546 [Xylaria bambusicola]KAI0514667.1 hypothetical protein F5B22DRAFT_226546 [Xylaria bambusicola]